MIKDIQDIKHSLEYTQAEVEALKDLNSRERLENLENSITALVVKTDDLENRSRWRNLCFEGIDEVAKDANETWQQSEDKVKTIISDKLELDSDDIPIERAHRVGARKDSKPIEQLWLSFFAIKTVRKYLSQGES